MVNLQDLGLDGALDLKAFFFLLFLSMHVVFSWVVEFVAACYIIIFCVHPWLKLGIFEFSNLGFIYPIVLYWGWEI